MVTIPGFAVLTRVMYDEPTADGAGFFCALAVPAINDDAAAKAAKTHLMLEGLEASVEDVRALTADEARDLASIRMMGERVHFDRDPD